jgi:serine/threonine protein kinase
MTWLPDAAMAQLRNAAGWPDFTATKYEIVEKLGQGGMASVYLARDRDLDRNVAVKVIHAPVIDDAVRERMLLEARVIARLEHPGILPIHDLGFLPDGRIYYVMKLVRGRRLDEYIRAAGPLPDRLRLFLQVCDAVAFAHSRGVIHRDLKPSNIMIGDFGEVLVIDWGLAKIEGVHESIPGAVLGTPGYMAPEQESGLLESIDERTDVYSLGILLRSMAQSGAPKGLLAICDKAQSATPSQRYTGAAELSRDVQRFLNGERVEAFREGPWETAGRLIRRHRTLVILIATYLAVRVILLLVGT